MESLPVSVFSRLLRVHNRITCHCAGDCGNEIEAAVAVRSLPPPIVVPFSAG
jgi:hypothetical protein